MFVLKVTVAKDTRRMVSPLHRSRKYLAPTTILHLYKCQFGPKMEYYWHICAGVAHSSQSSIVRLKRKKMITRPCGWWINSLTVKRFSYKNILKRLIEANMVIYKPKLDVAQVWMSRAPNEDSLRVSKWPRDTSNIWKNSRLRNSMFWKFLHIKKSCMG